MDEQVKQHLMTAYEGYVQSLKGVSEWVAQNQEQLNQALEHKAKMEKNVEDLKNLLGIKDEEPTKVEASEE
mgnify:CR=1 FL=1